jgi:protease-4
VLEDLYEDFLAALARDRGVDHEQVLEWMELAQFAPDEAREQGLIDGVLFWEALEERRKGDAEEFVSVKGVDYAKVQRAQLGLRGSRIAVVHGEGTITAGKSGWIYPLGVSMGDETMVEALQQVMENDRIKAVLLRLDTPGGLSLASDRIGRMVERVCKKKPVVVSTVDVNASGGYMISYRCSTLVALPSSIVGSIGSFAMRGSAARMMEKIGVTWDRVTVGPHATTFSPVIPLTGEEFERFEQVHWKGYERWVQGVAHHRGMSREQVDSVARGRVFTGRQALGNGLIDDLGGFDYALALCKQKAGIPEDEDVTLVHYPVRKEIWEELASGEWGAALVHLTRLLGSGTETQERVASTVDFWQQWFESKESLALYWWRF